MDEWAFSMRTPTHFDFNVTSPSMVDYRIKMTIKAQALLYQTHSVIAGKYLAA